MKRFILITICFVLLASHAWATNRYVTPMGTAAWEASKVEGTPCSLATANANADDDDVVILGDGTYNRAIAPAKAGSVGHPITFQAAHKQLAVIEDPVAIGSYQYGIYNIWSNAYIKVDGIKVDISTFSAASVAARYGFATQTSADHIEITNCLFTGVGYIRSTQGTHIWFHDNEITDNAMVSLDCDDVPTSLQLGYDIKGSAGYCTVENNIFRCGGHGNLETFTKYNIIRNNFFHNEGCVTDPGGCNNPDSNGKFGNRNITIDSNSSTNVSGSFCLIEGNRIGPSGMPPDDSGYGGEGMNITSAKNITRYNEIYSAMNSGILMKSGASGAVCDHNRIYNNTITGSGRYKPADFLWQGANLSWYGSYARVGSVIKNNILYGYGDGGHDWAMGSATIYTDNTVVYNLCTDAVAGRCSQAEDPLFTDGTLPTIDTTPVTTDPDLTLQAESPAIDAGTYLTQATGAGTDSTALTVDDALYFQDGTWGSSLSDVQADWIAIGTVTNVVQIESIDYTTNVITLTVPMTWADNANIWLYRDSDGTRVLSGAAPDQGAHESNAPDTVVSGTLVGDLGLTEDEIVTGGQEVDLTLSGTTWVADVVSDGAKKAALIAGITGNSQDAHGWNNEVTITDVTRISDTVVRVVVPASSGYDIESPEVVSAQIAAALTASNEVINATPNITIDIVTPTPPSGSARPGISRGTSSASGAAKGTAAAKAIQ